MSNQTKKTPEAWTKNLLLGSVVLNVFLVGFLFAKVLEPAPEPTPELANFTFSSLPSDIPVVLSEKLEKSFRPHQEEMRRAYGDLVSARVRVQDILVMEELDEVALEEALANIREFQIRIQGPMHAALIDAARDLDFEMRRKLAGFNKTFEGTGTWEIKRFDGARWRVEFEDGDFVLELHGITDREDEDDE